MASVRDIKLIKHTNSVEARESRKTTTLKYAMLNRTADVKSRLCDTRLKIKVNIRHPLVILVNCHHCLHLLYECWDF